MRSATIKILMTLSLWGWPLWAADQEQEEAAAFPSSLYTCHSMKVIFNQILRYTDQLPGKSLALSIDFDNTLFLAQERLARHFNSANQKDAYTSYIDIAVSYAVSNLSNSYILGEETSLWTRIQARYKNKLMSSQWPTFLQSAADNGIAVFINTARSSSEKSRLRVVSKLQQASLIPLLSSASNNALLSRMPKGSLPSSKQTHQEDQPPPPYFDELNILYTSGKLKGPVLESYMTSSNLNFDVIFHLDDAQNQVNSMFYTFLPTTTIHCFHYLPKKIELFSTTQDLNTYINKEISKLIPHYPHTHKDWSIPRTGIFIDGSHITG